MFYFFEHKKYTSNIYMHAHVPYSNIGTIHNFSNFTTYIACQVQSSFLSHSLTLSSNSSHKWFVPSGHEL